MIVRKLRLQRAWSQEQLAELTGLSTRTIQRIERGHPPSLETMNALASVFEVDVSTFSRSNHLDNLKEEEQATMSNTIESPTITTEEEKAIQSVQSIKAFYQNIFFFITFTALFCGVYYFRTSALPPFIMLWWVIGWGIGLVIHGLNAYEVINLFNSDWEKRKVEERLGRKL